MGIFPKIFLGTFENSAAGKGFASISVTYLLTYLLIISAKWTEWTGEISCDAFSVRPSVRTQYLDANISKTVWVRDLVPVTH